MKIISAVWMWFGFCCCFSPKDFKFNIHIHFVKSKPISKIEDAVFKSNIYCLLLSATININLALILSMSRVSLMKDNSLVP